jgi:hypothetical protein
MGTSEDAAGYPTPHGGPRSLPPPVSLEAKAQADARLTELCDRLPALALWSRDNAALVRAAVATLRPWALGSGGR